MPSPGQEIGPIGLLSFLINLIPENGQRPQKMLSATPREQDLPLETRTREERRAFANDSGIQQAQELSLSGTQKELFYRHV